MLKLSKYELRKNRNALLMLIAGLVLLQGAFMYTLTTDDDGYLFGSIGILVLYGVVCYFSIFMFAITNYYREINSRTSYLVFMTPISPLRIVLSKMITVLFLGLIMAGLLGVLAVVDLKLLAEHYDEYVEMTQLISEALRQFGINTGEILFNIVFGIVTFLLSFYSSVALIYLSITLSSTLLQNSRLKSVASLILYLGVTYLLYRFQRWMGEQLADPKKINDTVAIGALLKRSAPYTLLNFIVVIVCISLTTWLLKKKVSL